MTANFVSPDTKRWPPELKPVRDEVETARKKFDADMYAKAGYSDAMSLQDMVYDQNLQNELRSKMKKFKLAELYGKALPTVLNPDDYVMQLKEGDRPMPYILGTGDEGKLYLAQHRQTGKLVVIKALYPGKRMKDILLEYGVLQNAHRLLARHGFTPCALVGFFKLRDDSPMMDKYNNILPVISIASLVKDVPLCLPLKQAVILLEEGKLAMVTKRQWSDILYRVLKAVLILNEAGIQHGDYHAGNICITYDKNSYNVSVIDFGCTDLTWKADKKKDILQAFEHIGRVAKIVDMENTLAFAEFVLEDGDFEFDEVLNEFYEDMQSDL